MAAYTELTIYSNDGLFELGGFYEARVNTVEVTANGCRSIDSVYVWSWEYSGLDKFYGFATVPNSNTVELAPTDTFYPLDDAGSGIGAIYIVTSPPDPDYLIKESTLTSISNNIKSINGESAKYSPATMNDKLEDISDDVSDQTTLISQIQTALTNKTAPPISVSSTGLVTAGNSTHQLNSTDDADFIAENIKKDVNIFGVTGTHEGGGESSEISIQIHNVGSYNHKIYILPNFPVSTDLPVDAIFIGTVQINSTLTFTTNKPAIVAIERRGQDMGQLISVQNGKLIDDYGGYHYGNITFPGLAQYRLYYVVGDELCEFTITSGGPE